MKNVRLLRSSCLRATMLLVVLRKDSPRYKLNRQLLYTWTHPHKKHRYMAEGQILEKIAPNVFVVSETLETLNLVGWLAKKEPETLRLFDATELTIKELEKKIQQAYKAERL